MNFKQQLIEKATVEEVEAMNIQDTINDIIDHMNKYATSHEYKIMFIKTDGISAVGGSYQNPRYTLIVPKATTSEEYRKLFIDKFKEMGFDNEDIDLTEDDYTCYNMILRW